MIRTRSYGILKTLIVLVILAANCCMLSGQTPLQLRLDSTYKFKWDTTNHEMILNYRETYRQNERGYETESVGSKWIDQDDGWEKRSRYNYEYDDEDRLVQEANYDWSTNAQDWRPGRIKSTFEYNKIGTLVNVFSYYGEESTGSWLPSFFRTSKTNAEGHIIEDVSAEWNTHLEQWDSLSKFIYSLNEQGQNVQRIHSRWDTLQDQWILFSLTEHHYNQQGDEIERISYQWDDGSDDWKKSSSTSYAYDQWGNIASETYSDWHEEMMQWLPSVRHISKFDQPQRHIESATYRWDATSETWDLRYQQLDTYDNKGNQIEDSYITGKWNIDGTFAGWGGEKTTSIYNSLDRIMESIVYSTVGPVINWQKSARKTWTYLNDGMEVELVLHHWDTLLGDWEPPGNSNIYAREIFWYSDMTVGLDMQSQDHPYLIYPNPFDSHLTFENQGEAPIQRIEWINAAGRIVRTDRNLISGRNTLERGALPSGIYWLRVHTDETYIGLIVAL